MGPHQIILRVHLLPYFGKMALSEIAAGKVQEYRIHRRKLAIEKRGKPPSRTAMLHDTVAIRQVLKTAMRHGWSSALPDLSQPDNKKLPLVAPQATDLLFPMKQRGLLNTILEEEKLKFDRDGNVRTAYSLHHTYICFRLMEGPTSTRSQRTAAPASR